MIPESAQSRPESELLADLHVYVIPLESWRQDLQNALNEVIFKSTSLGFVRVNPNSKLADLREELTVQLDGGQLPENYVFLRSVGRCFAKVKKKQEYKIKVKYFLPPHASSQEIFLLPASADDDSEALRPPSLYSDSMASLDTLRSRNMTSTVAADQSLPPKGPSTGSGADIEESISKQNSDVSALGANGQRLDDDKLQSTDGRKRMPSPDVLLPTLSALSTKSPQLFVDGHTIDSRNNFSVLPKLLQSSTPDPTNITPGATLNVDLNNTFSAADRSSSSSSSDLAMYEGDTANQKMAAALALDIADTKNKKQQHVPLDVALVARQLAAARQARTEAEKRRLEVVKKVKVLQLKTDSRRVQARDLWKHKYFEEKIKTPALEEACNNQKVLLSTWHKTLSSQADSGKPIDTASATMSTIAEYGLQCLQLEYEVQELQMQVDRASMQLSAELKLRTQAETELRVIRAELVQQKFNLAKMEGR